jgi:tetratricopeptide (TPR) repeat protein
LARAAGDWWTALARDLDGEPGEVIALGTLDQVQDRATQFAAAVAAFDQHLEDSAPGDARRAPFFVRPPPDIGHDRYGTPLTLQLAALTALLETCHPLAASAAASGAQAEDKLLRHEERYWKITAHSAGLELAAPILRHVVATATLRGAGLFEDATSALASAVPGTSDLTQDQLHRLDRWLEGLYPPNPGQRWGSLQPDRLGEYLIATTLPEVPGLLSALLAPTDAGSSAGKSVPAAAAACATRHHRALTILARALANPALTEPAAVALLTQVRDSLAGDLVRLGPVALQVITETAYPGRMLTALRAATEEADQVVLAQLLGALPGSSLSLADMAAEWTGRRVAYLRGRVGGTAADKVPWWRVELRPGRSATLAITLLDLAKWLADLGRHEEALNACAEATDICGKLVRFRSSYTGLLAASMQNMSVHVAALGTHERALGYIQAAVGTLRALQSKRYGGFRPWWAALLGIGPIFGGGPPPADAFLPTLASALATQSRRLSEVGRWEEALAASTEAVATYRWLAWWFSVARPDAFTANLATALNNQSDFPSTAGWPRCVRAAGTR